jgi:hypothetical protein
LISKPSVVEKFISPKEEKKIETKLTIGVGYSILKDSKEAVREAFDAMMQKSERKDPSFVILTSTVGYDQEQVLIEVKKLLPKKTKIYGYTSLMGIMTNDGFKIGEGVKEGGVLSLTGFFSEDMAFGVGAADLSEGVSAKEVAEIAARRALENAGNRRVSPKIVLMSTSPFGIGEHLAIAGVENVLGKKIPIVGGGVAAGYSDLVSGGEALFANEKVYQKGVVVTLVYTDLKIGHAFLSGFNPTGHKGIVTEMKTDEKGIHIVKIDNKPAAQVYNNWLDGKFKDYLGTSEMFLDKAVNYTFGIKIIEADESINWQMIVPFHFNPDDSITVGAIAPEGTELYLLESNPDLFIKRAGLATRLARGRGEITETEIAGVVLDQCGGTLLGIPGIDGWNKMIDEVAKASGNAPFIGVSNLGPYGYFLGVGNRYGEVTASITVFGKY